MATFKMEGIDRYIKQLEAIGPKAAEGMLKYAVYPGAGVLADAIREGAAAHHRTGDLESAINISTMRNDNGFVNTQITFEGYDRKGVPNAIKARVLESGTSDETHTATHFISKATRRVKNQAIAAMSEALDEKMNQLMEE